MTAEAGEVTPKADATVTPATSSNNSDGLIKELREEAKNYRLKHKAAKSELDLYKLETEEKIKKTEEEKSTYQKQLEKYQGYNQRIVNTELKTEAVLAGIKDPDLIKLIDTKDIKVDDDGVVDIAALKTAINDLKQSKPFLFGEEKKSSTSSNAKTGTSSNVKTVADATKMTDEEYARNKRELLTNPSRFVQSRTE